MIDILEIAHKRRDEAARAQLEWPTPAGILAWADADDDLIRCYDFISVMQREEANGGR